MGNCNCPYFFGSGIFEHSGGFFKSCSGGFDVVQKDDGFIFDDFGVVYRKRADDVLSSFGSGKLDLRLCRFYFLENVRTKFNREYFL